MSSKIVNEFLICSALSVKEPFILPVKSNTSTEQTKKEFSQQSISDHKMLLNVFNSWSCVETGREVSEFIKENFIHNENMKMIDGVRNIVMRYLQTEGFLSNDALNKNSKNWSIIKGCLAAGLYRKSDFEFSIFYFFISFQNPMY